MWYKNYTIIKEINSDSAGNESDTFLIIDSETKEQISDDLLLEKLIEEFKGSSPLYYLMPLVPEFVKWQQENTGSNNEE